MSREEIIRKINHLEGGILTAICRGGQYKNRETRVKVLKTMLLNGIGD